MKALRQIHGAAALFRARRRRAPSECGSPTAALGPATVRPRARRLGESAYKISHDFMTCCRPGLRPGGAFSARLAAVILTLAVAPASANSARDAMEQGLTEFEKGKFEDAAASFDKAAQNADKEKLDPAVPKYNRGNTLYRLGRADEAQATYQEALQTRDLDLQRDAYFNRGNALVAQAEAAEQLGQLQPGVDALEMALAMYENAMMLDPADGDAKVNFEMALKKKELLEQMQQQQQQQEQDQDQGDEQQDQKQESQPGEQEQDRQDQTGEEQQDESKPQDGEPQREQAQPSPQTSEEMTPEEAEMLLDSMKQDEQARREQMRLFIGKPVPVDKDW